ncbi:uncharacterized protein C14orf119 homolog [Lepisosteus oculatus]|uniref:uncharacterized protein C14orf119 homolog n=1 Tax=Lepisosteus oculatus TaxID=7918 RepID=UPI0037112742
MSWFHQAVQGPHCPPAATAPPSWEDLLSLSSPVPPGPEPFTCPLPAVPPGQPEAPRAPPAPPCLSYVTLQEQRCVLSWLQSWPPPQKSRFLQDLLAKAVPGKICTLLDQLTSLQVCDRPPSIFECQLRLWSQWFDSWNEDERNEFLRCLEERDPAFVSAFYREVAGTSGVA